MFAVLSELTAPSLSTKSRELYVVMTQEYNRDGLGRVAGATAMLSTGGTLRGVSYQFDALYRRSRADWSDGTFWSYGYNDRGEVTRGHKQFAAGAFVGGSQYEYGYDDIGNRTVARMGGDAGGGGLEVSDYGELMPSTSSRTGQYPEGCEFREKHR